MFPLNARDQLFQRAVGGLLIVTALAAVGVIHLQRQAVSPFGQTVRLTTVVPRVDGMAPKSPVTIAGIKVGWVDALALTPDNQVQLKLEIDASIQAKLRADALATVVRPLLGTAFVDLQMGQPTQPALSAAGVLAGRMQPDLNDLMASLPERLKSVEQTLDNVNALSTDLRQLTQAANRGDSSVAVTLTHVQSGARRLEQAAGQLQGVLDQARVTLQQAGQLAQDGAAVATDARAASRHLEPLAVQTGRMLGDLQVLSQELRLLAPQLAPTLSQARQTAQDADALLDAARKNILLRGQFDAPPALPLLPPPR